MSSLEHVYEGEPLSHEGVSPSWEECISEWTEGVSQEFVGQLRQARAASEVARRYGRASMKVFAAEVGTSKTKVYDFARVWAIYGHLFEDGEFSGRLETLSMSHLIQASYAPDPLAAAEQAEDEGLSTRQVRERREEAERAEAGVAEVMPTAECPHCGGSGRLPIETGHSG